MSGIESALLSIGVAASKALFASWLRGKTPGAEPNESVAQLLSRRVPRPIQRRRAERQLEQVADHVTEQLQEFMRSEFREVPENEVLAAAALVSDLFNHVETDVNFLLASDLDTVKIESYLRKSGSTTISDAALSEVGEFVFNRMLRETAAYVVEAFTVLPQFSSRVLRELLRRETGIGEKIEQALAKLPSADEKARNLTVEDQAFETEYRRSIARKLDYIELFGASLSESSRRYTLSVSYVSLTVTSRASANVPRTNERSVSSYGNAAADVGAQRVEAALGYAHQRVLIRGEAGSGKTTLLHWLSVMSARNELSGGLESWNNRVPVYLPLRRFASSSLPPPEQFLDPVLPNLAGVMPDGWMHRLLTSNRALLLLDGIDELPTRQREDFAAWFRDLIQEFPEVTVVTTSRPAAIEAEWLSSQGVQSFELQPMSLQDIKAFVDHWHSAVANDIGDDEEQRSLARYRESLKILMEERRSIRALATNPLMCALICALNRDRRANLPRDRMELYRIALEMLLERRDIERRIPELTEVNLTYREKELLLEDLAYWLIRNGQSDATSNQAASRIKQMLPHIPQIKQTPKQILIYLVERSGLLRSPMEGRVDFLHRSFQEFLAAKAAVDGADIPLLIRNGLDDQWREVIILAAGHARPKERESLISGILDHGRSDTSNRHRLFLLAVACLETSTRLSPEMRSEVEEALRQVVPPKSQNDAMAIAAAKELATPFLSNYVDREPEVVAACVRALALIGDSGAMLAIKEYANDRRPEVSREVIRSWFQFPAEEYARKILSQAPLDHGGIDLGDASYVEYLDLLVRLRRVRAERLGDGALRKLGSLRRVRYLDLANIKVENFSWIKNQRIETLKVDNFEIDSWDGLGRIVGLQRLSVSNSRINMSGSLSGLAKLESLRLYAIQAESLQFIGSASKTLRLLSISECANLRSLRSSFGFGQLEELILEDNISLFNVDELRGLPNLRRLTIRGGYIRDLTPLEGSPRLEVLRLDGPSLGFKLGDLPNRSYLRIIYSALLPD